GGGTAEWVANGMIEAADKGADVINMSLGASVGSKVEEDAVNYAWSKGVVVLAASGNDGQTSKFWPAAYDKVIAVGASDQSDNRAGFSNYGADWVDVAAPGVDVLSTLPGGQYGAASGTSMACPNAAGVASLIISYGEKGLITNQEVRDILESTAVPVGNWVAKGRVDAQAAVSIAIPPIIETKAPTEATMFDGSSFTGTAASLAANDNSFFKVNSRFVSQLGGVAGTQVSYSYPRPAKAWLGGKLTFRGSAVFNSTVSVYLKKTDGTFQLLKSFPASGSQITQQVALPKDITPYLQSSKITLVARAVLPYRYTTASFTYSMNSAILEAKSSSKLPNP
ncbi:MAG TPA: S8 family serine peptidase, partial [Fimbriimonas sp.]|nr:S8 family serine peptidase [Fimbriimonas sp.]